jgi:hypothetical protein
MNSGKREGGYSMRPIVEKHRCQTNTPALAHNKIGMPQLTSVIACHHKAEFI